MADNRELASSAAGAMAGTAKIEIVGRICVEQVREWMEQRKATLARDGVLALDNYKDGVVEPAAGGWSALATPSHLSVKERLAKNSEVCEVVEGWCGDTGILVEPMSVVFLVEAERAVGREICREVVDGAQEAGWIEDRSSGTQRWTSHRLVPSAHDEDGCGGTVSSWCGTKPGDESVLVWGECRPHYIGMRERKGEGVDLVRGIVRRWWREWVAQVLDGADVGGHLGG